MAKVMHNLPKQQLNCTYRYDSRYQVSSFIRSFLGDPRKIDFSVNWTRVPWKINFAIKLSKGWVISSAVLTIIKIILTKFQVVVGSEVALRAQFLRCCSYVAVLLQRV